MCCSGDRRETYPSIYPIRLRQNSLTPDERALGNIRSLRAELEDDFKTFHVAVNTEDDEVVLGYSIWQKPGCLQRDIERDQYKVIMAVDGDDTNAENHSQFKKTQFEIKIESECDLELANKIKNESFDVKSRLCGGNSWSVVSLSPFVFEAE